MSFLIFTNDNIKLRRLIIPIIAVTGVVVGVMLFVIRVNFRLNVGVEYII